MTGFREQDPAQVRSQLSINGEYLVSKANGKRMRWGNLTIPTLKELRNSSAPLMNQQSGMLQLDEIVADVQQLHADPSNAGAIFQVASQFNLLEMVGPRVTPEQGVGIYENDPTQGPACAIACGAATIYRNYFVQLNGRRGQSRDEQIDCLADLGAALGNDNESLWKMRNGYALPSRNWFSQGCERFGIVKRE